MGGVAKGFPLSIPKGKQTRPTPVLLRRKLFDFRQDWCGWHFIDLCAGVGTVGLEAWSRGACPVNLVESSFAVYRHLEKNVEKLSSSYFEEVGERPLYPLSGTVKHFLRKEWTSLKRERTCWFFDPPYHCGNFYESVFTWIMDKMGEGDELWVQTGEESTFQTKSKAIKSFSQGLNQLDCYQNEGSL